jgi:hypothetical protein
MYSTCSQHIFNPGQNINRKPFQYAPRILFSTCGRIGCILNPSDSTQRLSETLPLARKGPSQSELITQKSQVLWDVRE